MTSLSILIVNLIAPLGHLPSRQSGFQNHRMITVSIVDYSEFVTGKVASLMTSSIVVILVIDMICG